MDKRAKGYWVGHVSVEDPQGFQAYREANAVAFAKFGGKFLVRHGAQEVVEGDLRPRTIVIEFPSLEAARACYLSPEYQHALSLRTPISTADLAIIEGWEG